MWLVLLGSGACCREGGGGGFSVLAVGVGHVWVQVLVFAGSLNV